MINDISHSCDFNTCLSMKPFRKCTRSGHLYQICRLYQQSQVQIHIKVVQNSISITEPLIRWHNPYCICQVPIRFKLSFDSIWLNGFSKGLTTKSLSLYLIPGCSCSHAQHTCWISHISRGLLIFKGLLKYINGLWIQRKMVFINHLWKGVWCFSLFANNYLIS